MEIKENNLKELIEKYMSIEETEENHEELHQLGHEIDHVIFDNNFYLVTHNDGEEKEIISGSRRSGKDRLVYDRCQNLLFWYHRRDEFQIYQVCECGSSESYHFRGPDRQEPENHL